MTKQEQFIQKAKIIHNNKYDYSNVVYKNTHTKVIINCPTHGSFEQSPAMHIFGNGQGCPTCAIEKSRKNHTFDFIKKANVVHNNKYDYSLLNNDNYINIRSKLPIICPIHGIFYQRGDDHNRGHGCKKCGRISCSRKSLTWLDHIALKDGITIQHAGNGGEFRIPNTCMSADGYCVETNTIYEFDGDAYHGNPTRYNSTDKCHPFDKDKTAAELYQQTLLKQTKLEEMGYTVVSIWESDFDKLQLSPINDYGDLVISKIDSTYPQQLKDIGITLIDEYKGSTIKHKIKYDKCEHEGYVTPQSKIQMYKKYGHYNCNTCGKQLTNEKNKKRGNYENRLLQLNYKAINYVNARTKCLLECIICGKQKFVTPSAIIQWGKPCCDGKM